MNSKLEHSKAGLFRAREANHVLEPSTKLFLVQYSLRAKPDLPGEVWDEILARVEKEKPPSFHYIVSPQLLYSALAVDQDWVPPHKEILNLHPDIPTKLNDVARNVFEGDPRIAALRENLMLRSVIVFRKVHSLLHEQRNNYEEFFFDAYPWNKMTRSEARATDDMMNALKDDHRRTCYDILDLVVEKRPKGWPQSPNMRVHEVISAHSLTRTALGRALSNQTTPFRPDREEDYTVLRHPWPRLPRSKEVQELIDKQALQDAKERKELQDLLDKQDLQDAKDREELEDKQDKQDK